MWRFRSGRCDPVPPPRQPRVEALEARALLSLTAVPGAILPTPPDLPPVTFPTVTLEKGVLTITGTGGDDQISVREPLRRSRPRRSPPAVRFRNFPAGGYQVGFRRAVEALIRSGRSERRPAFIQVGEGLLGAHKFAASRVRGIVINAGGGNDTVTIAVRPDRISAEVHGGAGDDTLVRACGDNSLPALTGGPGNDEFKSDAPQVTDLEPGETLLPRDCG